MAGGTISGNKAEDYSGSGAGVYVVRRDFLDGPGGVFEMTGGTISGNKAGSMGGGVCIESGYANLYREGVFTMKGGTITGNTAGTNGYVPYVPPGYKAGRSGGGVFAGGRFAMTGGTISGNNVENNNTDNPSLILATGGGVCVGAYGVFIMTGGTIRGNSAADFGGGVSVAPFDDTHFILGGAAVVAADNTVYLDIDSGPPSVSAFVMAASPLAPPGGISAVLEPADTSAGMALVKGYANTGPDDPLPSYTLTPADLGKFRYKQGGTLVPLEFSNGEGLIP
jgi:hypothetical protein